MAETVIGMAYNLFGTNRELRTSIIRTYMAAALGRSVASVKKDV